MSELNWAQVVSTITPLEPSDLDGIIDGIKTEKRRPIGLVWP